MSAPAWVVDSLRDKALYAAAHNYSIALDADDAYSQALPRKRVWGTLRALQRAVRGEHGACDWVWYIDLDTVVTAPHLDVLSATGATEPRWASRALLLTRDHMGLNTGAILARCGEDAAEVLEAAWATPGATPGYSTQCAVVAGVKRCGVNHPWAWQLALMTLMGETRVGAARREKVRPPRPVRGHRRVVSAYPRGLREDDGGAPAAEQRRRRQQQPPPQPQQPLPQQLPPPQQHQLDGAASTTAEGMGAREAKLERVRRLVGVLEQATMNSYPGNTPGVRRDARWRDGHFVLHLAGCGDQAGRSCEAEYRRAHEHVCHNGPNTTSTCGAALRELYAQGPATPRRTAMHARPSTKGRPRHMRRPHQRG